MNEVFKEIMNIVRIGGTDGIINGIKDYFVGDLLNNWLRKIRKKGS